ncbi:MAG: DUF4143 domain-containing protein [Actinomycetota bacterium]
MRFAISEKIVEKRLSSVLSKLGVSARAAVASRLAQAVSGRTPLRRQAVLCEPPVTVHHFRSGQQHEIDVILERADGSIVGFEVKAGSTIRSSDFAGMRYLQQRVGSRFVAGFVASLGADAGSFGNGCHGIHVSALWTS